MRRRPRILFAWELGANYGHIGKIRETARAIGPLAEIVVAARDRAAVETMAPELAGATLDAPFADTAGARGPVVSYPDALRFCGWSDGETLAGLIRRWRALIADVEPDMIVSQAAPTALLAARGGSAALALLGSGYDAPPRAEPMAPFLPTMTGAAEAEARTLAVARDALALAGGPSLPRFRALFDDLCFALCALPQTDHYSPRAAIEPDHPRYLGQLVELDKGAERDWAGDGRRRVVAYLRPGTTGFAAAVEAFAASARDWDVLLAAPGAEPATLARLAEAGARAVNGPLRLDRLLHSAETVVNHASNGIASAAVAAGVPQVLLPTQTEQTMCARALAAHGLAIGAAGAVTPDALATLIGRALDSGRLRAAAHAAADAIARETPADPAGATAARLLGALPRRREF